MAKVPTDAQIEAALTWLPDYDVISEDDNRYCNPPRTRYASDEERREVVDEMLSAALNA